MTTFCRRYLETYKGVLQFAHSFSASGVAILAFMGADPDRAFSVREIANALGLGEMNTRKVLARIKGLGLTEDGKLSKLGRAAMHLEPFAFEVPQTIIPPTLAEHRQTLQARFEASHNAVEAGRPKPPPDVASGEDMELFP